MSMNEVPLPWGFLIHPKSTSISSKVYINRRALPVRLQLPVLRSLLQSLSEALGADAAVGATILRGSPERSRAAGRRGSEWSRGSGHRGPGKRSWDMGAGT